MKISHLTEQELDSAISSHLDLDAHDELMFNPTHVMIPEEEVVDLIDGNGTIIFTRSFKEVKYINHNWDSLTGKYEIAENMVVLYTFTISHDVINAT